ncbi:MAG: hypothetical protein KDC98_03345 [Planctomycetes bacterium]|nr:hypothetical protein [Planctomycetota bacterium]
MKRLLGTVFPLVLLLLGGCLEFDAQEITMRYDEKADRIDFLVVYRGIFLEAGSSTQGDKMDGAFADLQEVFDNGQSFFWCNWPLKIDPVDPPAATAALAAHLEVEIGGFFTDPKGMLNGYEFVRIARAKEFLQKLNTLLEVVAQGAMLGGFRGIKLDADSRELMTEFVRSGEKMVTVEAGRIQLRLPLSSSDFGTVLKELEQHFLTNVPTDITRRIVVEKHRAAGEDSTVGADELDEVKLSRNDLSNGLRTAAGWRFFWDNEFTIERGEELQTVGIGARGNRELVVRKASDGLYCDNFLKALRERGDKIEDGVPDQEIRRRFDEFRQRAAVMPEALRLLREK